MSGPWTPPTEQDQLRTLFELGYFAGHEWDFVRSFMFGSHVVKDAIEQYAGFHGLSGEEPSEHMLRPRCGLPDFVRDPEEAALSKWRVLDVTTSHRLSGLNPLSSEREHAAWLEAIAAWSAVCGIRLTFIDDMPQANIYANPGSTGAGVLAWSYLPNNSGPEERLQQQFNVSVQWSYALLVNVMIHELGHAIGLDHGPSDSIMRPTASGSIVRPMAWDIAQAVSRYGVAGPKPPKPPSGFGITFRSRFSPGNYQLEANVADVDLVVNEPIARGSYRLVNEFEMG